MLANVLKVFDNTNGEIRLVGRGPDLLRSAMSSGLVSEELSDAYRATLKMLETSQKDYATLELRYDRVVRDRNKQHAARLKQHKRSLFSQRMTVREGIFVGVAIGLTLGATTMFLIATLALL